jgi:hypothetical protein
MSDIGLHFMLHEAACNSGWQGKEGAPPQRYGLEARDCATERPP